MALRMAERLRNLQLQEAQASNADDKAMIDGLVQQQPGESQRLFQVILMSQDQSHVALSRTQVLAQMFDVSDAQVASRG